jgi:glutamate racemase
MTFQHDCSSLPIGLFDSGIGGLTVMQELMRLLPHEQLIYFGDTARIPYGNKSRETVIRYSIENTITLLEKQIKLLVIACNTASALALGNLSSLFKIPMIGVVQPGAEKAVAASKNGRIAILGTRGTIHSGVYQSAILQKLPEAILFPIACPLFVPLVEEQWIDRPSAELIVKEYLAPLKGCGIDTALLGCTHYPLLRGLIQRELGEEVEIVDSASTCAEHVKEVLQEHQLLSSQQQQASQYFVSDDPGKFQALAERLFGLSITVNKITG